MLLYCSGRADKPNESRERLFQVTTGVLGLARQRDALSVDGPGLPRRHARGLPSVAGTDQGRQDTQVDVDGGSGLSPYGKGRAAGHGTDIVDGGGDASDGIDMPAPSRMTTAALRVLGPAKL